MKIHQIVDMLIIQQTLQILQVKPPQLPLEAFQITSSTPATSIRRLPTIEALTATIGRLLRTVSAIATTCSCIVPTYAQVPITALRAADEVLGVR